MPRLSAITVKVETLHLGQWTPVEHTGGTAEQFRTLIMDLGSVVTKAKGDLCRARRKLGAALVQIKRQVHRDEWTAFVASLELNEKTVRNAICVVDRLCRDDGEFDQGKLDKAKAGRPGVIEDGEDLDDVSMAQAEKLAGLRSVTNGPRLTEHNANLSTRVDRLGMQTAEQNTNLSTRVDRVGSRTGAATMEEPRLPAWAADVDGGDVLTDELDDDQAGDDAEDSDSDADAWNAGAQMTFEGLRMAAVQEADRLRDMLARPDADRDLVQRFHAWAQASLN